jgi:sterol desaturase/sphingolipid hydroxylase (fatty acid hydroxylase superfamily)
LPRLVRGRALAVLACFGVLALGEQLFPLRRPREAKARRWLRNLALAGLGAVVQAVEQNLMRRVTAFGVNDRSLARSDRARLPEVMFGILALDYTLYLWHVLTHEVPFLWRFHAVHHADRDLDATTALRFHVGELCCSIPWRIAQVHLLGISPRVLSYWQTALLMSLIFQHSNLRLPERFERRLAYLIVTPRLHGIHHSIRVAERNCNWSSGLTVWDRVHGTFRNDVLQEQIQIGIAEAQRPEDVTLDKLLLPSALLHDEKR